MIYWEEEKEEATKSFSFVAHKLDNVARTLRDEQDKPQRLTEKFLELETAMQRAIKDFRTPSMYQDALADFGKIMAVVKSLWTHKDFIEFSVSKTSPTASRQLKAAQQQANLENIIYGVHSWFLTKRSLFFIYRNLNNSGKGLPHYENFLVELNKLSVDITSTDHHLVHTAKKHLTTEISLLTQLITAQINVQNLQMKESLVYLYKSKSILDEWKVALQQEAQGTNQQKQPSRFSYQWLHLFYSAVLSKSSLYFLEGMGGIGRFPLTATDSSGEASNPEPRQLVSQLPKSDFNFVQQVDTFSSRTEAFSVSIMIESERLPHHFEGVTYECYPPLYDFEDNKLRGIKSWVAVFTQPKKAVLGHWPNVINIVFENRESLDNGEATQFYDRKVEYTYMVGKVEALMYLVAIYKKKEGEGTFREFGSLCHLLRMGKLYDSIKL
ncbi:hypothetical protein PROFUN_15195 [Planoprotostelium fungivorum]|uniref:Uncharacterized protein n=1 Tax=Planoprotostelium fungivorum TaxID=1890364 RepID=A0A2P6MXL4_9EUKA|nr:hypothetical protein PROFUN_15195 [Planoprotostelium fungivorum]